MAERGRREKALTVLFAAITGLCLIGLAADFRDGKADRTLRIGLLGSPEDEDYDGALAFKSYVEGQTGGRVRVEIFPSGQFCSNARECIEALRTGTLDIHMTTVGGFGTVFPPAQVLDLPYAFRNDAVAECVMDGPMARTLRHAVLDAGLGMRLMTLSNTGGWRNFATTRVPVERPEDLAGLKIRTTAAPLQQELARQLGANPTPVAWAELYTALATGVVQGTKNGIQDIVGMKFHEHLSHIVLDGHSYMGALWWFSQARWQQLAPSLRRIVTEGFDRLQSVTRALPKRRATDAYAAFKAAGGTVHTPTPQQKAAFRQAAAGLHDWFAARYGRVWLDRLDRAVARCDALTGRRYDRANEIP